MAVKGKQIVKQSDSVKIKPKLGPDQQQLISRPDYESALETLERYIKLAGALTKPSGIIHQTGHGQWRAS